MKVHYDASLLEAAVLRAVETRPREESAGFRAERDRAYAVRDPDARELAFHEVHTRWFARLDLAGPIERALRERAELAKLAAVYIVPARRRGDEMADVAAVTDASGPQAVIRLTAEALIHPDSLIALLRHELQHVSDMLDPDFGYQRELPRAEIGPSHDNLLRDRYRVVWDTCIDGRLVRKGLLPAHVRAHRASEFARAFLMLGDQTDGGFERWWEDDRPTHDAIVHFITSPRGTRAGHEETDGRCPLCDMPTATLLRVAEDMTAAQGRVARDFPRWRPEFGICRQCADLYGAHT